MKSNVLIELNRADDVGSKATYSSPCLKIFGSISALTMGQAGTKCDSNNGSGGGGTSPFNPSSTQCPSDISLKENIVRIGTHPFGFGMYLFDYKPEFRLVWGYGRQFGVMANEVKSVLPEAVVTHPDGYMMVDYALLGITRTVH